ncbi:uncharacterized WD repeat-containing protein C2A9.03 isoform X2 [Dioscorea cayenensis subsp. rotundata]|uniref:Uncharacterized WD repeat-containing protein C2A9.03 isoform X2 n=1 Tax=Dioscorea cayennensis subsp. rotundata TaxID=55577 RepID=A0AB40D497_DIOCR|nr:uncharacterized WD repeat-containing protein C2A9.03 isoform X2 [Dioscorea cayenensis subsp. rotundata]
MAQFFNNDLDYVVEDYYDVAEFDDNPFENDDNFGEDEGKQKTDTSALDARNGKDIQGIPWERLKHTRDEYRQLRLKQYKNYENLPHPAAGLRKECKEVEIGRTFYDFQFNTRLVKSTIVHFQLRNLLWATSKHDVYMMQNYSIKHWSSLLQKSTEVLNVAGQIVPNQEHCEAPTQAVSRVQVSTMAVKDDLIVSGGFHGELICKYVNQPGVAFCTKVTSDDNGITNSVDIYESTCGSRRILAANNDCNVRIFDIENFTLLNCFPFSWSVNCSIASPDGKYLAVLGDSVDCLMAEAHSGKVIGALKGHLDYCFASAWHPDGNILATGSQDMTCRLWDIRNLSESMSVLKGRMGAIRGIKFSSDGRFLAIAEPADFVHVYDVSADYNKAQEIDLFGEIAGLSFSPDTEALFIGIADRTYGSLLEFKRRHHYHYLNSFM